MTEVYDLDAVANEGEPFKFRFGGEDYELPADLDITILSVFESGDAEGALKAILGAGQWQRMVDSPQTLGVKALQGLFEAYSKHLGFDSMGGSLASVASSPSTAKR